jgi:hypothetical protein
MARRCGQRKASNLRMLGDEEIRKVRLFASIRW